jgi:hypothetical protein
MVGTPCRRGRPGTKKSDVGLLGGILSLRYAGWINSGYRPLAWDGHPVDQPYG